MRIKTLLVANRGEIALRIIRTARGMGIRTVAVYSEIDRDAPYVREADTAFYIGPAEAALSYLDGARIIKAALQAGANAVHPGYGFLSENADFAEACITAGLSFVGPPADVIRSMGSKIEAKKQAVDAGIPVVPGYNGSDQSDETLLDQATTIGLPLMIKASAGGGGRGMRLVEWEESLKPALAAARAEAEAAFGDPVLLLERYIRKARHIEVQLLCDSHGAIVHLFERDCSLQRNHQKVIEEAPAPRLKETLRQNILNSAVKLARAAGYQNVGTVEYLIDDETGGFFFLEMNTRLQVEHAVTEAVTGFDLVEWQLRVASGEPLGMTQADITCTGCAIEARVAAEDPADRYRPETGTITNYVAPDCCRIDSGVEAGSVVTHHYDSMLAKVISSEENRPAAIAKLDLGLSAMRLDGLETNLEFLTDLLRSKPFEDGNHDTGTITALYPDGWQPLALTDSLRAVAVLARYTEEQSTVKSPWQRLGAWRSVAVGGRCGMAVYHLAKEPVEVFETAEGVMIRLPDAPPQIFTHINATPTHLGFEQDGQRHDLGVSINAATVHLSGDKGRANVVVETGEEAFLARMGGGVGGTYEVRSPMPGLVVELLQNPGTRLKAGDAVIVIEAMKLMQTLVAPCDGLLSKIYFRAGDTVEKQALLATFIPEEAAQ